MVGLCSGCVPDGKFDHVHISCVLCLLLKSPARFWPSDVGEISGSRSVCKAKGRFDLKSARGFVRRSGRFRGRCGRGFRWNLRHGGFLRLRLGRPCRLA